VNAALVVDRNLHADRGFKGILKVARCIIFIAVVSCHALHNEILKLSSQR
jgi:hypothetical protein